MKGYRTYLVAALLALVTAVLPALSGLDWVAVLRSMGVSEVWVVPIAGAISAGLMWLMRSLTTTPPGVNANPPGPSKLSAHAWLGIPLAVALVMAGALAGCARMGAAVETSDAALSRLSRGSLPAACATVAVAEGYFDALAPRISAANHARYDVARAVADRICATRPADTASAMITLAQAWVDIQAATRAN